MPTLLFIEYVLICLRGKMVSVPAPGIEPGPAGWEPAILTTRPCRKFLRETLWWEDATRFQYRNDEGDHSNIELC